MKPGYAHVGTVYSATRFTRGDEVIVGSSDVLITVADKYPPVSGGNVLIEHEGEMYKFRIRSWQVARVGPDGERLPVKDIYKLYLNLMPEGKAEFDLMGKELWAEPSEYPSKNPDDGR